MPPFGNAMAIAIPVTFSCVVFLVGFALERLSPAQSQTWSDIRLNLIYLIPYYGSRLVLAPIVVTVSIWSINMLGGGWLVLPSAGLGYVIGLAAFTLTMDLGESAFHLAQHKIPFLWAMHSLHHSDRAVNISTTQRHHWADFAIKTVTIYTMVGILFKANAAILMGYNIIGLWNYFVHMNVRIGFGRWSWIINSPQYHRLHHSLRPEDYNLRYAAIFPLFDLICGTYRKPDSGDYPETGLADRNPSSIFDAVLWPLRTESIQPSIFARTSAPDRVAMVSAWEERGKS